MSAAQAVLAALHARGADGEGEHIDVSMVGSLVDFLTEAASTYLETGQVAGPDSRPRRAQAYACRGSDGRAFVIHMSVPEKFWTGLLEVLERPDLASDPRFASREARVRNYDELDAELKAITERMPRQHWLDRLVAHDIPHGPLNTVADLFDDPQVASMGLVEEITGPDGGAAAHPRAEHAVPPQRPARVRRCAGPRRGERRAARCGGRAVGRRIVGQCADQRGADQRGADQCGADECRPDRCGADQCGADRCRPDRRRDPRMSRTDDLVAIDVHTHPQTEEFLAAMGQRHQQMAKHFGRERPVVSFAEQADQYRDRRMMAVIVNSDSETTSGIPGAPNDLLGRAQADHPDVFLAFAGIDPWKGEAAIAEIRRMHAEYGIKGVGELNPSRQKFLANDRRFFPIWEACAELGLVVMFHSGFPGAGAGTPGGGGYRLENARPGALHRRRRRRVPRAQDHQRPPGVAVAPREPRDGVAQVERVPRPLGLGAEVPAARGDPLRRLAHHRPGALRIGLAGHDRRPMDGGVRRAPPQGGVPPEDPARERARALRDLTRTDRRPPDRPRRLANATWRSS